jgi:hypothetical protein
MILALLLSGVPLSLGPSRALAANTTIVVSISSATRVFDLGPNNNPQPANWGATNFDISLWDHAVPVSGATAECIHNAMGSLGHLPLYWGPRANDFYLVRIPFLAPAASSYNDSSIAYANYDSNVEVWLFDGNGTAISTTVLGSDLADSLHVFSVDSLLKPGINTLGLWENPNVSSCGPAIGVRISIQAQGVKGGLPTPRPAIAIGPAVALSFPANNAIVTGTSLPLAWSPFPHASAYLVHVWLVKADPGQAVTASTVANTALTVIGTRASVSTANMLKGVYGWDVAALDAKGALIAGWGAPRNVQIE